MLLLAHFVHRRRLPVYRSTRHFRDLQHSLPLGSLARTLDESAQVADW